MNELIAEIGRTRFLLETKTAAVFESQNFIVEQNLLPEDVAGKYDRLVELDVLATSRPGSGGGAKESYIVECKGAASHDKLVLIPTRKSFHEFPSVWLNGGRVRLVDGRSIVCENGKNSVFPACCHSGDFFLSHGRGFQRSSKQDDRNNLNKGIVQLHEATQAIFNRHFEGSASKPTLEIIPTIVTNAEIHLVKYDLSKPSDQQTSTTIIPWAVYINPMISGPYWAWTGRDGHPSMNYAQQRRIPIVWIVNFDHLESFIRSYSKTYSESAK